MTRDRQLVIDLLPLTLLIAGVLWFRGPALDAFTGKLTAYPIVCDSKVEGPRSCSIGRWQTSDRAVFAVRVDQQTVVVRFGDWQPSRLTNCVVLDRKNWRCDEYVATDGAVSLTTSHEYFRFVPRWRWYLLRYIGVSPV